MSLVETPDHGRRDGNGKRNERAQPQLPNRQRPDIGRSMRQPLNGIKYFWISSQNSVASGVVSNRPFRRSNKAKPIVSSKLLSSRLTLGCEILTAAAAAVTDPASTTALKGSIWRGLIASRPDGLFMIHSLSHLCMGYGSCPLTIWISVLILNHLEINQLLDSIGSIIARLLAEEQTRVPMSLSGRRFPAGRAGNKGNVGALCAGRSGPDQGPLPRPAQRPAALGGHGCMGVGHLFQQSRG